MDYVRNLRENLQVADRLFLLALVVIIVIGVATVLVAWKFVLPAWQDKQDLTYQLAEAQKDLDEAQKAQEASPGELRKQAEAAQAKLDAVANTFFSDSQAREAFDKLYQYALESGVEITNRQIIPVSEEEQKDSYYAGKYQLQVEGSSRNLVDFVSRIKETAFDSFVISNLDIAEVEGLHTLNMDVALYTSPYSTGAMVQPTPQIAVIPGSVAEMEEMLAAAWDAKDWGLVIDLIERILALEPGYDDMTEKLYAAHVNYGEQLLGEGDPDGARVQFDGALEIKPDGMEAQAGRQRADTWAPTSTPIAAPTSAPARTLTVEEQLAQSLHEPWAAKQWEKAIGLIQQILAINPGYDDMVEKLYAAHVNYGQQLSAEGRLEEAKVEFTRALEVKPNGGEAMLELQALAVGETPAPSATSTPTPASQLSYTVHVVKAGENLYRISLRYGTTVQAIMTANGLTGYYIYVGQQLRIPLP